MARENSIAIKETQGSIFVSRCDLQQARRQINAREKNRD